MTSSTVITHKASANAPSCWASHSSSLARFWAEFLTRPTPSPPNMRIRPLFNEDKLTFSQNRFLQVDTYLSFDNFHSMAEFRFFFFLTSYWAKRTTDCWSMTFHMSSSLTNLIFIFFVVCRSFCSASSRRPSSRKQSCFSGICLDSSQIQSHLVHLGHLIW